MPENQPPPLGAVIDIGSNAIRLRIGGLGHNGRLNLIESVRAPVRLGQDVFQNGELSDATIDRTLKAFSDFRVLIDQRAIPSAQVRAVATSAMREADNRQALIEKVQRETGIPIEVISGEEEARLVYQAIQYALPELAENNALLIDIGGGSVEFVVLEKGEVAALESFKMGTVRLLSQFSGRDSRDFARILDEFFDANAGKLRELIDGIDIQLSVGTGGNIETLGQLGRALLGNDSPKRLSYANLKALGKRLDELDYDQRVEQLQLRPDRADVIIPACHTLRKSLKLVGKPDLSIPGIGLAEGTLLDLLRGRLTSATHDALAWARAVARKYHCDMRYVEHIRRLALTLFDQLATVHGLPACDRLLLEMAALIHEIGIFVRPDGHHRHAYYLIGAMPMLGISAEEQKLLAAIVRAHRKKLPDSDSEALKSLDKGAQQRWLKLVALLRLAIALNKERQNAVQQIQCLCQDKQVEIACSGEGDFLLERWAVIRDREIIERGLDRTIEVIF
ncbi:MAG: hypothetical protein ACPW60_09295 [Methylohalobius sp. ZOD2]